MNPLTKEILKDIVGNLRSKYPEVIWGPVLGGPNTAPTFAFKVNGYTFFLVFPGEEEYKDEISRITSGLEGE